MYYILISTLRVESIFRQYCTLVDGVVNYRTKQFASVKQL